MFTSGQKVMIVQSGNQLQMWEGYCATVIEPSEDETRLKPIDWRPDGAYLTPFWWPTEELKLC